MSDAFQTKWVTSVGRVCGSPQSSPLYDDNRNAYPSLVREGLLAVSEGHFDGSAIESHLGRLAWMAAARPRGIYSKEHRRLTSDRAAYGAVLSQLIGPAGNGTFRYRALYRVVTSGRVFQRGGGLQSASGAMKAAAYGTAVGGRNYDLADSQLWGLRQYMEAAGLACSALSGLLDRPGSVAQFAADAGIPKKRFKGIVFSVIYGAALPEPEAAWRSAEHLCSMTMNRPHHTWARQSSAPIREVFESVGLDRFSDVYMEVYSAAQPIFEEARRWRHYLTEVFIPDRAVRRRNAHYLYNAAGMPWNSTYWPSRERRKERDVGIHAAAHLLQGLEAAYIHALASILHSRGVRVVANEHDGLVCLGAVLPEDEAEARRRSGLWQAKLVEKPFQEVGHIG